MTKRHSKSSRTAVRDGLKRGSTNKRHGHKSRRPPLLPVPSGVALVLELVNLLPVHFRSPYWARRNEGELHGWNFGLLVEDILYWEFDRPNRYAALAFLNGQEIGQVARINTPSLLWSKLRALLTEFPLQLQAFVLRDEQRNEAEMEGERTPLGVHPDLQSWLNAALLSESEGRLKDIIREASDRIEKCIEDELSGTRPPRIPDFDAPEGVLERARHRLILILGIQELFSYLLNPEHVIDLFFATRYYHSDAARAHFYIDEKDRIQFAPPRLVALLEGVDANRIRECPVCYRFFWAGRKDMTCCTTRCSGARRMRKFRDQWGITKQSRFKSS